MRVLLRDVELGGRRTDVVLDRGVVASIGSRPSVDAPIDDVIDGSGGALLPGLWDHHIHLLASAAAMASARVGPPDVTDADGLTRVLRAAVSAGGPDRWVRAVGYHASVAGPLDRWRIDAIEATVPIRVQDRSGHRWTLNSIACVRAGLAGASHPGIERDARGKPTGVVTGADGWLRSQIDDTGPPDLAPFSRHLARHGVVGVTDATPDADAAGWLVLAEAQRRGELAQHVVVTGGPEVLDHDPPAPLQRGPVKLYLRDEDLPDLDRLTGWIIAAHDHGRNVAFHSVTRTSLAFAVAALDVAGGRSGDRIEHGSIIPPEFHHALRRHHLTVVTQANFVAERGDHYLAEVDPDDRDHLYPCATLLAAGIPVGGSTDAPFGVADPWRSIAAAVDRATPSGVVLGAHERIPAETALDLFSTSAGDPGGPVRRVVVGSPADLCILDRPRSEALRSPAAVVVRATLVAGRSISF